MKIIQINTTVNSGSTGRIAEDIGKVLLAHGHESYIAYGRGNQKSASQLIKIGDQTNVWKHGVKTALLDRHGFGSKKATQTLITTIEKIKPDAIGLHNIHGYYLNINVLFEYLAQKNIPIIWTLHDCWAFTGHCTYFDSVGCEKWKTQCYECPKTKMYPTSYFLDNSKKNYLDKSALFNSPKNIKLITPSHWLKEHVENSFLKHPVYCIHNGIDLNHFQTDTENILLKNKGLSTKKVVLGIASIWDIRKGLNDFIQLAEVLPVEFQVILIGLSVAQLKKLPKNIIGIGRTENTKQLAAYYDLAEVFVNPTYQDNFPTTNLEALACGTPVITYDTGGSPEAINTKTGIVVPKGDITALKTAIETMGSKGKEHYAAACRTRAEHLFNRDHRYLEYLELYETIGIK